MKTKIDISQVVLIALEAGRRIMELRPNIIAQSKSDGSPVTQADLQADDIIQTGLKKLFPNIPVISEENSEQDNREILENHDLYWITDPLDGTESYLAGYDGFGVHIGLIKNQAPLAGVVYFPAEKAVYFTDGLKGAWQQQTTDDHRLIKDTLQNIKAPQNPAFPPRISVSWRPHVRPAQEIIDYQPVCAIGGARFIKVASGAADLALIENIFCYWDIAAAHAILSAAGGDLYETDNGKPICYPNDRLWIPPCIGGNKIIAGSFRQAIKQSIQHPTSRNKKNILGL